VAHLNGYGPHLTTRHCTLQWLPHPCLSSPTLEQALVHIIPKPGKTDYFAPEVVIDPYRSWTALGSSWRGRVAKHITHAIDVAEYSPESIRSWLDRAVLMRRSLSPSHHPCTQNHWQAGALLFDISGFFDNIIESD